MAEAICQICLGLFAVESHRRAYRVKNCQHPKASPGSDCWFEQDGLIKLIADSLTLRKSPNPTSAELRDHLLRGLQGAATVNENVARQHVSALSSEERWSLLKFASDGLRDWLLTTYRERELIAVEPLQPVRYPDLPEGLLGRLKEWEDKNRRRLNTRIENGHSRASTTLRRRMVEPIALADFLAKNGITRWDAMKMSDRVAFAKTRPGVAQRKLRTFLSFIDSGNAFKVKRGRPPKKAGKVVRETRQIPIVQPDALKERLSEARKRLPPEQYLLFWLVAKLGLTAKAAYDLTLDCITINTEGRLVIRPAEAWFALPKSIAPIMKSLAQAADASWPYKNPAKAPALPVMHSVIKRHRMGPEIFQNETTLLRSSAIFAAMHEGQLDRKTLSAITGVSKQTISEMEFLVPADIHSLVSHDLVAARNRAILGNDDE